MVYPYMAPMLIDFTRRSVRIDPTERPGLLVLRAASTHNFHAQLAPGEHDGDPCTDGGLFPDAEWEDDRMTTFKRFREWAIWQGLFEDVTADGKYAFTIESAFLADGEHDDIRIVQVALNPVCLNAGWEIELKTIQDEPVSFSLIAEDYDQSLRPESHEDDEDDEPAEGANCFSRLLDD